MGPTSSEIETTGTIDSMLTQYGTSHQTYYQLNLKPELSLRYKSFRGSVIFPLSTGITSNTSCCRFSVGNLSMEGEFKTLHESYSWWVGGSVSAPTASIFDAKGLTTNVAATVAITDDAGFFLSRTTTLRANAGADLQLHPLVVVGGEVGLHRWIRSLDNPDQTLIPITVFARISHTAKIDSSLAFKSIANLDAPSETWLHQTAARVSYRWNANTLSTGIEIPLDRSLRDLGMVRGGVSFSRSY
ncbi:MAG: hypothetical protein JKY56_00485 [Kofleriaceae bacterium]|nr:hypothetical protein [Kofleriaceae bacterium]